jgi:4-amino-4-deoxy-L-arabinose transferase-like glycosyltransferase
LLITQLQTFYFNHNKSIFWTLIGAIVVSFLFIFTPIIEGDSSLYASISKGLFESNNFYELKTINNGPWLDKPHFPFWIQALIFHLIGISSITYKFSGFIFLLISIVYTYKYAKLIYDSNIALLSILILSTSFHLVLSIVDLRAEIFQTAMFLAAVYYVEKHTKINQIKYLILSGFFIAMASLTKGIFIGLVFYFCILFDAFFIQKNKQLINQVIQIFFFHLLFLIPEFLALHFQFGFSKQNINGQTVNNYLDWFFIKSQFGRFFNNGPIKSNFHDYSMYLHTLIWAFFPWSFLFFYKIKNILKNVNLNLIIWIVLFFIFSISKFQLSHYIVLIFPFISISLAAQIHQYKNVNAQKVFFAFALLIIVIFNCFFIFISDYQISFALISIFTIVLLYRLPFNYNQLNTAIAILGIFFQVSIFFYFFNFMSQWDSNIKVANFIDKNQIKPIGIYDINPHSFHFQTHQKVYYNYNLDSILANKPIYLYTTTSIYHYLFDTKKYNIKSIETFDHFESSRISTKFLNPKTRSEVIQKRVLLYIE